MENLTPREKITRARVLMGKEQPFFAYMVLKLKPIEKKEIETIGININGNLYYNPEWIKNIGEDTELKSILTHEVLHLVFNHLIRQGIRNQEMFNIASDICINNMLYNNGFEIIKGALNPINNRIKIGKKEIVDIDKKSAEKIYEELYDELKKNIKNNKIYVYFDSDESNDGEGESGSQGSNKKQKKGKENNKKECSGKGNNKKELKGFDVHILSDGKETATKEQQKKWKRMIVEATTYAKNIGKLPAGMERLVEELIDEKINWKELLYRYVTNELNYDWTYSYPSKKSQATGIYLPSLKKENIDIIVSIDTSGSISKEELSSFICEIINLGKSFNNLKITLIVCDCEIKDTFELTNGNIEKAQELLIKGGGGTSHIPVYNWIEENMPNAKLLINFTDGFSVFPDEETIKTIWILTEKSCEEDKIPFGNVIKMGEI